MMISANPRWHLVSSVKRLKLSLFSVRLVRSFIFFFAFSHRSTMSEIELKTAPGDYRFPTTNQSRHCFTRYIEFHRCVAAKGDGAEECGKFAKYYRSLCPGEWVERWNEQRENRVFPGPL
ncbi:hypothetical protein L6452_22077 [Arctium lappa]|uniref:Uncharacterized protein n=1 Tax=Arctium lappa TaxID=4217 RepID=A0ACB9AXZ5_ARCLA|nr:hypothetical protein L6452_22077 [Arctium lappa]